MRDPARIDRVLDLIHEAWIDSPDLRLGQLISNAAALANSTRSVSTFYIEDDRIETGLRILIDRRRAADRARWHDDDEWEGKAIARAMEADPEENA